MSRYKVVCALLTILILFVIGCSSDSNEQTDATEAVTVSNDSVDFYLIQEMFEEVSVRWHYGDKAALYDAEFPYLRAKHTYDEYLTFGQIVYAEADTLVKMVVHDAEIFDQDSAYVQVEAIFVGPKGDTSRFIDKYRVHYMEGRWFHATMSVLDQQLQFDDLKRKADSAIAAEEALGY